VNTLRLPALFFVALTGNLGRAIIVDHNHSRHFERYSKLKRLLTGLLLSRVRRLELVGEHLVDHYKKSGIPLPNAVEFISPFIEPVEEDAARLMAAYPPGLLKFLDNRHPVLLTSVWRLSADIDGGVYGVGHCLALLARLTLRFPSIGLIVAIGDAHDKEYVATVVKASAAMGLKDNTFVASNIGELWPLMRRSDLFLRLTNTDGASVSLREALHFGCPIIATDVVPRPEGVMLVHYGDVDGMEHAAIKSLAGTGRRARNGEI
jgi:glycosyltransferase involved in cell wall biosynthesis